MNLKPILAALTLALCLQAGAQTPPSDRKQQKTSSLRSANDYDQNILKPNITGLALRTLSLQYERILSPKISAGASLGFMPSGKMPLLGQLKSIVGDPNTYDHLQNLGIGAWSVTPEVRFYLGRHSGARGFYIAPFARFSSYRLRFDSFSFSPDSQYILPDEELPTIDLKGNITSFTGGFMLGSQWRIGKNAYLDWWIAGAGYGRSKGELNGIATLTDEGQQALTQELNALEIAFVRMQNEVNANGARVKLNGPWGDIRAGIAIGVGF